MKHVISILFFSVYLVSCHTENKNADTQGSRTFPVVIDTVKHEKNVFSDNEEKITWLSTAHYPFLYIGTLTDTIFANYQLHFGYTQPSPSNGNIDLQKYYIDWLAKKRNYRYGQKANVEIRIDTTKKINNSYPILLTNNTKDTIAIGYGNILPLIMEAKDSTGLWKPIEEPFIYSCGNGIGTIILPPNEVVLSLTAITQGNYPTELRLAYGDNHSQAFKGVINYRQFESRYNKEGNYKEEYIQEEKAKRATNK